MSFAEPVQIGHHFSHSTAGIALTQPGCNIGVIIIQRFQFLNIDQDNGYIQVSDGREHIVGCGIGQQLQEYQIHISSTECVSGSLGLFLGRNDAAVYDLDGIRNRFFECVILCLEFRHQ